ncbi:shugoshin 2 isoform X5 [Anas platyrhynchos]|uniref:shugoshin 2 isoform X5 n=1 Tax=Anas platyrhynchos TaxID=8839 RepID=UPI000F7CAE0B|eukprot:XP_027317750.1 shugoshin 2 isoform X3 [Anas platyrhynchos]
MDKQATAKLSTTSDAVKRCMKRDRTSQTAKLNASLASKIKTKLLNNSSMFKVSLKQNNKALALALSVERESSRKLKKEKLFLQKEVEKLQLYNTLLHRKLSCLNKTLVEIEAFLNDNLLAAIEISSLPENLQSFLALTDGPSNCTDDQLKSMSQSASSAGLPVKLPLLTASTGKQQGSPSVYEITKSSESTTTLSKDMHSDQVKFALSLPSGKNNQKINEVDKVETNNDKNIVLEENHLHGELYYNSAFLTHINNTQSLRQSEELIKQKNISLPFCGNVPERRNHAALYRSKPQPNINDLDKKCISDMHHHGSSSQTNYMNLQGSSSGLSHIIPSPLEFNSEGNIEFKSMLLIDKTKPEETVYDADMELTASDAGSLFQEDLSNLELQALDNPKFHSSVNLCMLRNSEIWGKNNQDKALDVGKAEQKVDRISRETFEKTLAPGHGRTAFQDLTNTSVCSHASLPTCPKVLEENSAAPARGGRPKICYKEPGLRCKLRRGDPFTDTQFLHFPVYKVKNRRSFKSKSKII